MSLLTAAIGAAAQALAIRTVNDDAVNSSVRGSVSVCEYGCDFHS